MHANVIHARNPFNPWRDRDLYELEAPLTITAWLERQRLVFDLPTICIVNGDPVLRAEWPHREIAAGDLVAFVALPQGGGGDGSNPLMIVAMIVVSVVAPGIGTALAGQMGVTSAIGVALIKGAVAFAGMALINALIPAPKPSAPQTMREIAAASPTYTLQAQGNQARLGSPIPSIYGTHLIYPDFGARPYAEFVANEQYLYQLFVIGQGYYTIEEIRIEDTPIAVFENVTYEIVAPGGNVTLFPTNVSSSAEVVGQDCETGVALGPFVANASGTLANYIAIDVVMPRGLFYAQDDGSISGKSIAWTVEAQPVDSSGTPTGGWATLGSETYEAATNTAQRASYRYGVTAGRYQVRLTRTDTKDESSRSGHDLAWFGLRAYLTGGQSYGDITVLAMRMQASNQLSGVSSRKINVTVTRKLPIWASGGGGWSAPTETQSIAWALADICRAEYGGELVDARIDVEQLVALDEVWEERGDTFNAVYDSRVSFWDALTSCARAGRAAPILQGGVIHFVRDALQTLPVALFTMRNIVRGSMRIEYVLHTDQTTDAAEAEYFDETTWSTKSVLAVLPSGTSNRPAKLRGLFGVTNRAQAWREAMYAAAQNRYRRKIITFQTELEGFIPTFGDLIAIAHDMPAWGTSGEVTAFDSETGILTLSEPVSFSGGGTFYIAFRREDGSVAGPFTCLEIPDEPYLVYTAGGLGDFVPQVSLTSERSHFAFGKGEMYRQRALVTAVRARGDLVEISCVSEVDTVHTVDGGSAPSESTWDLPGIPTTPSIPYDAENPNSYLSVITGGTVANPTVTLSWSAAPGAERYVIEQSFDNETWTRVGESTQTRFSFTTVPGDQHIRVAPVGSLVGGWIVWHGTVAGAPQLVEPVLGSVVIATAAGTSIIIDWSPHLQPNIEFIEILRNAVNDSTTATVIGTVLGNVQTFVDTLPTSGLTYYYWIRLVNAKGLRSGMGTAVSATTSAVGGIEVVDTLPGTSLTEGRVVYLTTDKKIYRYNGTSWTRAADGGDLLAASVTADKVSVANLAAINANLGAITAGSLNINSRFVVDTAGNVTISNAASGARLEIKNNVIKVYDGSGTLRVKLGDLSA